mmetsp:Transcript_32327/g.77540  ORF Transcript_32327/g.77540 Transcript_32327/m.77540 type:complete len:272 (-) Transcript_32327:336-1151(-)
MIWNSLLWRPSAEAHRLSWRTKVTLGQGRWDAYNIVTWKCSLYSWCQVKLESRFIEEVWRSMMTKIPCSVLGFVPHCQAHGGIPPSRRCRDLGRILQNVAFSILLPDGAALGCCPGFAMKLKSAIWPRFSSEQTMNETILPGVRDPYCCSTRRAAAILMRLLGLWTRPPHHAGAAVLPRTSGGEWGLRAARVVRPSATRPLLPRFAIQATGAQSPVAIGPPWWRWRSRKSLLQLCECREKASRRPVFFVPLAAAQARSAPRASRSVGLPGR